MNTEQFIIQCNEKNMLASFIMMDRSVFLWLGMEGCAPELSTLVSAMETKYGTLSSTLISVGSDKGSTLAQRISKRFNIQAFVSDTLPELDGEDRLTVEKAVVARIAAIFS